jgi:hypothetical protein
MRGKWAIKAVFIDEKGEEKGLTIYEERLFNSEKRAIKAINDSYGEELVQACEIDVETEEDLIGLIFDDLIPIKREGASK